MRILLSSAAAALLTLVSCTSPNARVRTTLNTSAALTGEIPIDPLQWRVITLGADPRRSAMFTLFGNDVAIRHSRTSMGRNYPNGSGLALVTWQQQEDSRWFGGRVPAQVKSVEFVTVRASEKGRPSNLYRTYAGFPLRETTIPNSQALARAAYLLSLRAAVMP